MHITFIAKKNFPLLRLAATSLVLISLFGCTRFNNPKNQSSTSQDVIIEEKVPSRFYLGPKDISRVEEKEFGLYNPFAMAFSGNKMFLVVYNSHRINVYDTSQGFDRITPSYAIGQFSPSFTNEGTSNTKLSGPRGIEIDGERMYVADTNNHRVLIWNQLPKTWNDPANIVLGQADFSGKTANRGLADPAANTLNGPVALLVVGSKLIVSDTTNQRVLIWNDKNTLKTGQEADVVVGQSGFTTKTINTPSRTGATLSGPRGLASDGTKLLIADNGNHRVLIFNSIPTTSGVSANNVIGQASLTAAGTTGTVAHRVKNPYDVKVIQGKVFVAEFGNDRISVWNSIPSTDGVSANYTLGQTSLTSADGCNRGTPAIAAANTLCDPQNIGTNGTQFFVSDSSNNRVLVWNTVPTQNDTPADYVIGQPNFKIKTLFSGPSLNSTYYHGWLTGMAIGGGKFAVSSYHSHRVLIWNSIPKSSNVPADLILGQPDFESSGANNDTGGISNRTINGPRGIWTDGNRLAIADSGNNRILIWNTFPKDNYTPADIVLGQANFTTATANAGGISAKSLSGPRKVWSDGTKFIVADSTNQRILIWNSFPQTSHTPAEIVLGQPDMTSNTANNGGISANTFRTPVNFAVSGEKLLVIDQSNYRVLIWNSFPKANQTPADVVLGQPNFTTATVYNAGEADTQSLGSINGITVHDGRLIVAHKRVSVWNTIPTSNFAPADGIIGTIRPPTLRTYSEHTYSYATEIAIRDNFIYAAGNNDCRLLGIPIHPILFYTFQESTSKSGQLTAIDCSKISEIFVNEGDRPLGKDSGWQKCSLTPGAIHFELKDPNAGVHLLKAWMKDDQGRIKSEPITLPYYYIPPPPTEDGDEE